ncbi:MAG: complex I NDUFA9 subunit family protein [Aestuariivita sp.]|nr:complex I NDUFA9 subunit family protein [Aestuariivita sp.]MCY4348160.1 complex I NDUFA9 subunit family protein [Aestuariivita sp.]
MSKLATVYGGSGFIGRYIVRRLASEGWRVRIAVRRPNEALFAKTYGVVGQVEPCPCNVRQDSSVQNAMLGADAIVNCVGILAEAGKNTFDAVQAEAPSRIAKLAAEQGITTLVNLSAIGADPNAASHYSRSKAAGDAVVQREIPTAVILRPSIVFGPEDQFFNRFAAMTQWNGILPIVGAKTKFQPVYVDDVAKAAAMAVQGRVRAGIYELGGPEIKTFQELMEQMLTIIRRRRAIVNLPLPIAKLMGVILDTANAASMGLIPAAITRDQVRNLARDNVVASGSIGFEELGITPTALDAVLPEYLWRFRPAGQFAEIKESAQNIRS